MLEKAVAAVKAEKIVAVGKPNTMGLLGWTVGPLRAPLKEKC
jgi:hypothetical protein